MRELKAFFHRRRNGAAVLTLRQDMAREYPELEAWLTSEWPQEVPAPKPVLDKRGQKTVWDKRGHGLHQGLFPTP